MYHYETKNLTCFKAYDIRGKVGSELTKEIAYIISRAAIKVLKAESVVVGFDARQTSTQFAAAIKQGAIDSGAHVYTLGLSGTEEVYWAVKKFDLDLGFMVTGSHNPKDYNGIKIVKTQAIPLEGSEMAKIKQTIENNNFPSKFLKNQNICDISSRARESYVKKLLSFVDVEKLKFKKIIINSGNGAAGPTFNYLAEELQDRNVGVEFYRLNNLPDPSFPNGVPNPMLAETHSIMKSIILHEKADFGVAFDGDFDRCFLFDDSGSFVSSSHIASIIIESLLQKRPGAKIIHDRRNIFNLLDTIQTFNGESVYSKTGHNFFKQKMRETDAIYGVEASGHHYFCDFGYCDSGMIPWLLIWEFLSNKNNKLSELIRTRKLLFPASNEMNFKHENSDFCISYVENYYESSFLKKDKADGISLEFEKWRFNLRKSNTEPYVRLNIETKKQPKLLRQKIAELSKLIKKSQSNLNNSCH